MSFEVMFFIRINLAREDYKVFCLVKCGVFLKTGSRLLLYIYSILDLPPWTAPQQEKDHQMLKKKTRRMWLLKKKLVKLENKVKSIVDRSKDSWNVTKAYDRVTTELSLFRLFVLMLLSLFKSDDFVKLEKEPFQCGSKCKLNCVSSLELMIRERFVDDDFLSGKIFFKNVCDICVKKRMIITSKNELFIHCDVPY